MAYRTALLCCLVLALLASTASAQNINLTGMWGGQYAITDHCDNGAMFTSHGAATAQFLQIGSAVSGGIVLSNAIFTDGSSCTPRPAADFALPMTGTISAGTLTGTLISPDGAQVAFSASIAQTSMTLSFPAQPTTSGVLTLSLISSQTPDTGLSGMYTGTFSETIEPCLMPPSVTFSGTMTVTLLQVGSFVVGTAITVGDKHDHPDQGQCTLVDAPPETDPFIGEINGSTLTLRFLQNGKVRDFTTTVSGTTISGGQPGEGFSFSWTRVSSGLPGPSIVSFIATPSSISVGGSSTLSWSTVNAASLTIDNGIGAEPISGNVSVSPVRSTSYTLTAAGIGGSTTATATVTVGGGAGPHVVATVLPSGLLEASGQSAADSFTLANVGSDAANVSLAVSGNFFTIAPTSFSLQPGSYQTITIIAAAQAAGTHDGAITISGDSIAQPIILPVHLLVAAAPTSSVNPQANIARVDVSAPANQNPAGSVSFTNSGAAQMIGIAVADVPWIVPQSGTITINPGETKAVSFTIDRTKRPDSAALAGGQTGSISLRFLGSPLTASRFASDATPTSTVTITIVDVVQPSASQGAPPPLGNGELALFISGHGSAAGIAGDLFLANRGALPVPDLKLFLSSASQFAQLPQLASNFGLTLPSVSTSVFGFQGNATLMLRGTLDNIAAAAMRMVNSSGSSAYFTAVPVFRSDRGVAPGGKIVLSGVEKTSTSRTTVIVQEMRGLSGSADLQAYDANGVPTGAKVSLVLSAFVSSTDAASTIVEGAQSLVITNTSSGSTRINAYARVEDINTGDGWIVVDPSATIGATDTLIVPMISTPMLSAQTDLYVTNATASSVNATVNVIAPGGRRRAVGRSSTTAHLAIERAATQQLSIAPLGTQRTTVAPENGYVRISGVVGSISASGRVTMTSGGKSFGSALPVLPASSAMGTGTVKRFAGVGDASVKTIANGTPATFRSSLLLVETTGQSATVRVSVWYTFPAGSLVSAQTVSTQDFTVGASQMVIIRDLARSVIGPRRDAFGDLRDMQVDVEVVGGAGQVLPFLESIDNGSGDLVIRAN